MDWSLGDAVPADVVNRSVVVAVASSLTLLDTAYLDTAYDGRSV
jgi:hypothetical protein